MYFTLSPLGSISFLPLGLPRVLVLKTGKTLRYKTFTRTKTNIFIINVLNTYFSFINSSWVNSSLISFAAHIVIESVGDSISSNRVSDNKEGEDVSVSSKSNVASVSESGVSGPVLESFGKVGIDVHLQAVFSFWSRMLCTSRLSTPISAFISPTRLTSSVKVSEI